MRRRGPQSRSDEQILARPDHLALLRAVAEGRVVRGADGGDTTATAAHYLDGEPVRMQLVWLQREDLVEVPLSGPPRLAPRGRRLLTIADRAAERP